MDTTSITINTNKHIKTQTQKLAKAHGLSVSEMLNSVLTALIKNTAFIDKKTERPTAYLLKSITNALQQKKEGKISPRFTKSKDASKWLNT